MLLCDFVTERVAFKYHFKQAAQHAIESNCPTAGICEYIFAIILNSPNLQKFGVYRAFQIRMRSSLEKTIIRLKIFFDFFLMC